MQAHRFTVITPCYNAETHIETTLRSVLESEVLSCGDVELEYIVCDGGSRDDTIRIVDAAFSKTIRKNCSTEIISEKDRGMYDAIAKGLAMASGSIITYINAGDFFSPYALTVVTDIFQRQPVEWLTGLSVLYNEMRHITGVWLPYRYQRRLIRAGYYDHRRLPFIQQAGTFWSADLNRRLDLDRLKALRYAGDFLLWKTFSFFADLYIIETWLAGHMIHRNQLSADMSRYYAEMDALRNRATFADRLHAHAVKPLWYLPNGAKKILNRKTLFRFDPQQQEYTLT
ncbi:MAG: glycosyltransferase [Thermodesulfobacteriota bacterium]